jgi:hypothetical protein
MADHHPSFHFGRPALDENEACHGVAESEAGRPILSQYLASNYALASHSSVERSSSEECHGVAQRSRTTPQRINAKRGTLNNRCIRCTHVYLGEVGERGTHHHPSGTRLRISRAAF